MNRPPEGHRWAGRATVYDRRGDVALVAEDVESCQVDPSGWWILLRFRDGVEETIAQRNASRVHFDPTFAAAPYTAAEIIEANRTLREWHSARHTIRPLPPVSTHVAETAHRVMADMRLDELGKVNAALRDAGIDHPQGARGVEDLATMHRSAEDRLKAALDLLRRILGAIDEADPIGSRFGEEICAMIDEQDVEPFSACAWCSSGDPSDVCTCKTQCAYVDCLVDPVARERVVSRLPASEHPAARVALNDPTASHVQGGPDGKP